MQRMHHRSSKSLMLGPEILVIMSVALNVVVSLLKIHKLILPSFLESDKDIYRKLEDEFGETVLYAPKFDMQTAALWLSPLVVAGVAVGGWAYKKHRQRTNVHIMALNLVRGVALTPKEKETMLEILTPPTSQRATPSFWWSRLRRE
ncbi:Cytochrome c-type biogenesis CcmH-like mitochondrial protein [Bienertia sinuspersici]